MRLRVPASLKICEDRHIKGPLQGGDHYPGSDPTDNRESTPGGGSSLCRLRNELCVASSSSLTFSDQNQPFSMH